MGRDPARARLLSAAHLPHPVPARLLRHHHHRGGPAAQGETHALTRVGSRGQGHHPRAKHVSLVTTVQNITGSNSIEQAHRLQSHGRLWPLSPPPGCGHGIGHRLRHHPRVKHLSSGITVQNITGSNRFGHRLQNQGRLWPQSSGPQPRQHHTTEFQNQPKVKQDSNGNQVWIR